MQTLSLFEQAKKQLGYEASGLLCPTNQENTHLNTENITSLSEWVSLEKARRLGADYVYFRRYGDRPSHPLIYVYDYSNSNNIPDELSLGNLQREVWSSSEVPCIFVFFKNTIRIVDTSQAPFQTTDGFLPINLIETASEINDEIEKRFSAFRLDSGEFWNNEVGTFSFGKSAHQTLLSKLIKVRQNFINAKLLPTEELVNRLLIQCVLIRFLEEKQDTDEKGNIRKVFPDGFFQNIAQARSFKDSLQAGTYIQVFDYLNDPDNLNGKIFEWTDEEKALLKTIPTEQLVNLLYDTSIDANDQVALWDLYSFQFLPVEVISSIYEALFTTDENVKKDGMVYTPPHLAAFLVDEAMPLTNSQDKIGYKVLDPSCGSGVFLVLAFKRLTHWWRIQHKGQAPTARDLTSILENSIYGVDKEKSAIMLTRFSLCLALCDMLTPPEIWSSLHFPTLENQLVESDFFYWSKIQKGTFDLVIGNPPLGALQIVA